MYTSVQIQRWFHVTEDHFTIFTAVKYSTGANAVYFSEFSRQVLILTTRNYCLIVTAPNHSVSRPWRQFLSLWHIAFKCFVSLMMNDNFHPVLSAQVSNCIWEFLELQNEYTELFLLPISWFSMASNGFDFRNTYPSIFSVAKATLHSQRSVCLFVCLSVHRHKTPQQLEIIILQHSSFFIHPSFILRLLSFSACFVSCHDLHYVT